MIELEADLFTSTAPALGHGVNTHGVMGAGIAVVVRASFPGLFERYVEECSSGRLTPGKVHVFVPPHDWPTPQRAVFNMATQDRPGPYATLLWVRQAAGAALALADSYGFDRVAIPRIGCGIGGLRWNAVRTVLADVERRHSAHFEVFDWKPRRRA